MKQIGENREMRTEEFEFCGERFTARFAVTGGLMIALAKAHATGALSEVFTVYNEVLDACVIDQERFAKTLTNSSTVEDVADLVAWLIEESTSRPTPRPSLSQPGPETTGPGATVPPPSPEAT